MRKKNLVHMGLMGILSTGLLMMSSASWADDASQLKDQVQVLQQRVDQLESELADKQQAAVVTPPQVNGYQGIDPYTQMMLMRQQMERNMRQAQALTGTSTFNPRMDMKKTDKQYIITMDIPGMDKDKINVENKEGMLIISGERRSEAQDNIGTFMQAIPLPEDAQTDRIEANYKDGVLTVTIARQKKEEKKPEGQRITVK